MKKIIICVLLLSSTNLFSQPKNEFTVGYGKQSIFDFGYSNHYHFFEYSRRIKESKFYFDIRNDVFFEEILLFQPSDEYSPNNLLISPGVKFVYEGFLEHEKTNLGIYQLKNIYTKEIYISLKSSLSYRLCFKKFGLKFSTGFGLQYVNIQGILSGTVVKISDPALPMDTALIAFESYQRGLDFVIPVALNIFYQLNDKIDIGFKTEFENTFIGGLGTCLYQSINIGFKF